MAKSFLVPWLPTNKTVEQEGYEVLIEKILNGETPPKTWEVENLSIKKGDSIYLMRLDAEPKGIIAKGIARSKSQRYSPHSPNVAVIEFIAAIDYRKSNYLRLDTMKEKCPDQDFSSLNTGIAIDSKYDSVFYDEWNRCFSNSYNERPLLLNDIKHNIVIIRISMPYCTMKLSDRALYEDSRCFWKCSVNYVKDAEYVLAVINGKVVEVYKIDEFVKAEDTRSWLHSYRPRFHADCISFNGKVADDDIRNYYLGRQVDCLYDFDEEYRLKLFLKGGFITKHEGMNIPVRPKNRIRKSDGSIRYVCGYCGTPFSKLPRCSACGQLAKA